jgi:phospholipid transport system substrate-binding protein
MGNSLAPALAAFSACARSIPLLFGLMLLITPAARAQQAAIDVVRTYQAGLLDAMRRGQQLGFDGRFRVLEPVVTRAYDLPYIAQRAAGAAWNTAAEAARQRYIQSFTRFSVAQHASRFKNFSGERFEVLGSDDVGRGFTRVRTQLVTPSQTVSLDYLLGQRGGGWRIVDVFLRGTISEVATRRADFASTARDRGLEGLAQELEQKVAAARGS